MLGNEEESEKILKKDRENQFGSLLLDKVEILDESWNVIKSHLLLVIV